MSIDTSNKHKPAFVLSVLSLSLSTFVLFIFVGIEQYTFSIYGSLPPAFWLFIFLSVLLSMYTYLHGQESKFLLPSIIAIIIILYLPISLDYYIFGFGDVLTHIGYITDIESDAQISSFNFYPLTHTLTVMLHMITNIGVNELVLAMTPTFALIAAIATGAILLRLYVRVKHLFLFPLVGVLAYSINSILYAPSNHGFFIIPIGILSTLLVFSDTTHIQKTLLIIISCAIILYHPVSAIFFIIILFTSYIYNRRNGISVHLTFLSGLLFSLWYSRFVKFKRKAGGIAILIINNLTSEDGIGSEDSSNYSQQQSSPSSSPIQSYLQIIEENSPEVLDLTQTFLSRFGTYSIYGALGIVSSYAIFKGKSRNDGMIKTISILFILSSLMSFVSLFIDIDLGVSRFGKYVILFATLLAPAILNSEEYSPNKNFIFISAFIIFVMFTFTLYPSPISNESNQQVSKAEIEGTNWFFEHHGDYQNINQIGVSPFRYYDYHYGINRQERVQYREHVHSPPDHFGRSQEDRGTLTHHDSYLVVSARGKYFYQAVYPEYRDRWAYTPNDYRRLDSTPSTNKIYTNSGFWTYHN